MNPTEKRLRQLERILEVNLELVSTVELAPLLDRIVSIAAELTDSEGASILLLDERSGDLRFCTAADPQICARLKEIPVPVHGSIAGKVLSEGEPIVVTDATTDPRHFQQVGLQTGFQTRSLLAVPLQTRDRRIGVLEAVNKRDPGGFTHEDVEILTALAAQAAVAIENARLVEALRAAYRKLGELDRLKSDFIAIASHELRTPLSLILGYAGLLQEQGIGGQELEGVLRAAYRLKHIIETMLNLRYLETGEMALHRKTFDLREEIVRACEAYRSLAKAGALTLEWSLPDTPLIVQADQEKIRLVLDNLLSNAVKFTPQGGRVEVHAIHRPDVAEIVVADTGVGIPPEALPRIFERFYQAEDPMTRRYSGMGLGLSIVKEMVERHGGRVWAESTPGAGSRFYVRLPLSTPDQ
ncbi:MAG: GAF domain-containing sensor histidine kinase [Anaerolineae bacterium]|nr:GAF domain-containing sensor histidine kinase [Anaerolineae bacterium]MDW8069349.1 GAF domain-containing sensor histidine kinase [Anaerolineae bacterium]